MNYGSKRFSLFIIVLLAVSSLIIAKPAVAVEISLRIEQPAIQTTYVNQAVNITAIPTSGTPPYTYQWYTQLWNSTAGSPIGEIVAFSGATSSTFKFVESTPGTYDVSLNISDSAGNGDYDSFPISGVWVIVQPLSASSPTSAQTATPQSTPTSTPTVPEFSSWMLSILTLLLAASISFVVMMSRQSRRGSHTMRSPITRLDHRIRFFTHSTYVNAICLAPKKRTLV